MVMLATASGIVCLILRVAQEIKTDGRGRSHPEMLRVVPRGLKKRGLLADYIVFVEERHSTCYPIALSFSRVRSD